MSVQGDHWEMRISWLNLRRHWTVFSDAKSQGQNARLARDKYGVPELFVSVFGARTNTKNEDVAPCPTKIGRSPEQGYQRIKNGLYHPGKSPEGHPRGW